MRLHRVRFEVQLDTADILFSYIRCLLQDLVELVELLKERLRSQRFFVLGPGSVDLDNAEGDGMEEKAARGGGP